MDQSFRCISHFASFNFVTWLIRGSLITAIVLGTAAAKADKDPDSISESLSIARQIAATSLELQEVTQTTDRITEYALSYAYDPAGTIQGLYAKLTAEQKALGTSIQRTRKRMVDFSHDPEMYEMIQANLKLLEARYSDVFNEIIETNSKRRLPVSLIGRSKADAEALFARKAVLTERFNALTAQLHQGLESQIPFQPLTCESLFKN